LIRLTIAEVRRLMRAMMGPEEHREFRLGWSLFRRAHQAVAKRCHEAAHKAKHATYYDAPRGREPDPARTSEATTPTIARSHANKEAGLLTDGQWERVRACLTARSGGRKPSEKGRSSTRRGEKWAPPGTRI